MKKIKNLAMQFTKTENENNTLKKSHKWKETNNPKAEISSGIANRIKK